MSGLCIRVFFGAGVGYVIARWIIDVMQILAAWSAK